MTKLFAIPNISTGRTLLPPPHRKFITKPPFYNQKNEAGALPSPHDSEIGEEPNSLPASVSAGDVREVVHLLRRKPEGIKISKVLLATHKRIFESKKISGFEKLQIVKRENQLIKLSALGWKFADNLRSETEMFRTLLLNTPQFSAALQWISEKEGSLVTAEDISLFWKKLEEKMNSRENSVEYKESAITFFHLCQAADLGTMTLGKRGRITRLLTDQDEIQKFVANNIGSENNEAICTEISFPFETIDDARHYSRKTADVLIIAENDEKIVLQIETIFDLAGISFKTFGGERHDCLVGFDEKIYRAFDSAYVGCFVVAETDVEKDSAAKNHRLKESVLCKIGAALFGFRSHLIVISTVQFDLPERLSEITHFQINGDLSWEIARKLVDKIKEMKSLY